jgi:tight adherence protein C
MDILMQLLTGLMANQQGGQWGVVLLVSGAIFILALALMSLFNDVLDPVRSRFKREVNTGAVSMFEANGISATLRKHNDVFVPSSQPLLQRTATRLHHGGFHGKSSLLHYYAIRMMLMILLPLAVLMTMVLMPGMNGEAVFQFALVAIAIGYMGPSFVLDKIIANRQKTLRRAFPDMLDLLVVCSEAGLSLDAAIQKVVVESGMSQPVLASELEIVIAETRAGIERNKALQRLVERTGVEDIRGLVAALSQSMRFGTSIVETLKIYSEDLRDKRTQAAEEVAAKISTKLIFPLAVCLLPAFLMVVMLPAVLVLRHMTPG